MTLFNCKHGVVFMGRIVIVETGLFVTIKPVKFWFVLPGNLVVYSFFNNNNKKEHENPSKKNLVQIEGMEVDENPPKSITNQCVFFAVFMFWWTETQENYQNFMMKWRKKWILTSWRVIPSLKKKTSSQQN